MCDFGFVIPCGSEVVHKTSKAVSVWMDGLICMSLHECGAVCGRMWLSVHVGVHAYDRKLKGMSFQAFLLSISSNFCTERQVPFGLLLYIGFSDQLVQP